MKKFGIVVLALFAVGIIFVVIQGSHSPSSQPSPSSGGDQQATGAVTVTGGSNGASCSSGGYFKPASVTIKSGESVTFTVPSDDPYAGGLQIMGLPGGIIVIPRGGSKTTPALSSSVSYSATWPNETECKKGSGSITVQ
jgi:hypothetical protein